VTGPERRSFVDGPGARFVAVLVILVCGAALAYLHREALFSLDETPAAAAGNPQLAACFAERFGAVDKMQAEGIVNEAQYAAFRAHAEAFCQQQFGENTGGSPGAPPGLPR
jgi:hypothetical protein